MTLCKACMQQSTLYPLNAQLREKLAYSVSHTPDAPDLAFDKVSFKVGIDTCASATMSHNKDLFEDLIIEDLGGCQWTTAIAGLTSSKPPDDLADAMSLPWSADGRVCYTKAEAMVLEWDP